MTSTTRLSRIALAVLCAGLTCLAPPVAAADGPSVPRPGSVVDLEVQVHGGELFQVTLWQGQVTKLSSTRHDLTLLIGVGGVDRASGEVDVWVGEAVGARPSGLTVGPMQAVRGMVGFQQPLSHFPVDVRVVSARSPTRSEARSSRSTDFLESATMLRDGMIFHSQSESCCVTCGGDTLCGCRVRATCGSCCGGCCGALAK